MQSSEFESRLYEVCEFEHGYEANDLKAHLITVQEDVWDPLWCITK